MRRAILAVVSTVVGLMLLLGFKTQAPGSPTTPPAALAGSTGSTGSGGAAATQGSAGKAPAPSRSAASSTKTVSGDTEQTPYGPVQVQVQARGGKIVDIRALQLPQGFQRDLEIDRYAVPQLRQEALQAQSAHIDMVSGATYTSDGYIRSLQSALDQLHG